MGKSISLFNDYQQGENVITNYSGLVLKMLYEDNPSSLEEVISNLTNNDFVISPIFEQQKKEKISVPDLTIRQNSFTIHVETKLKPNFSPIQIKKHLKCFDENSVNNILFLLSNFESDNPRNEFSEMIIKANKEYNVTLSPISFELLVGHLEEVESSDLYKRFVEEYKAFLDSKDCLPTWKYLLDVVNCASTINEVYDNHVYMCPDAGGKYKHRRALFFGGYKDKLVKYIYEIEAHVVVEKGAKYGKISWQNNTSLKENKLIEKAISKTKISDMRRKEIQERSLQVFLLKNPKEVNFKKDTHGGLYSSKKYFYNIGRDITEPDSEELSQKLLNRNWSDFM